MYQKLSAVVDQSGIWSGPRKESHAFLLSPSVYRITASQREELTRLGYAIRDCLAGLSHIAVIAYDAELNYRGAWILARQVFSSGIPRIYQGLQGMNVRHIPALLKVDLLVDREGRFRIAEIDGHNKHGLGYSSLALRCREVSHPDAETLPGTVRLLSEEVRRLGYRTIKIFYGNQERFYVPEFEIARQEFAKHGIDCVLKSEADSDESFLSEGLFLDLPFLYDRAGLYDAAVSAYRNGKTSYIIPPKPFLGAKGVLALLRNDGGDGELESLLRTFIRKSSLDLVRQAIPETYLVGKRFGNADVVRERLGEKRYVLKESISSGMKGTVFSDNPGFDKTLGKACSSANLNWILQEEIENAPQTFSWYDQLNGSPEPRELVATDWFMRVTAQYVKGALADAIVTARRDKAVHGAKDCLQLGTVVV